MQGHALQKVYVARVQGCFPEGLQRVDAPLCWDPKLNLASVTEVWFTNPLHENTPWQQLLSMLA